MWADILLLIVVMACVATDLYRRKIYNVVIFPGMLAALLGHGMMEGWAGLSQSLIGLFAGLGILLIPYLMGGIGAGDVKMLALVGALKGASFAAVSAVYMGAIGGVMAIGCIIFRKRTREFFAAVIFTLCARICRIPLPWPAQDKSEPAAALPYGVAIGGGALATLFARGVLPI
jgi:prepilin peptidase CpaA